MTKHKGDLDFDKRDSLIRTPKYDDLAKATNLSLAKNIGGKNSPVIANGHNGYQLEEGDNTRYVKMVMLFNALPDIDLFQPEQVRDRIGQFFNICADNDFKPTTASFFACLGLSRREGLAICNDYDNDRYKHWRNLPEQVRTAIKKGYVSMEQLWESFMLNGKINPVSAIFIAKNNYGYVDKVEHELSAKQTIDESDLRSRYQLTDDDEL